MSLGKVVGTNDADNAAQPSYVSKKRTVGANMGGARAASRGNVLSILDRSRASSGFTIVCYGALSGSQIPEMPEVIRTTR